MSEALQFRKFVSEDELAEAKQKRQEEWERVRKPHEPEEAPEEDYDPRSLFERLESNRVKKQEEWDEAHRLKNMVKGLENDEIDFLEHVNRQREQEERDKQLEERLLLAEYKSSMVVDLTKQQESEAKPSAHKPTSISKPTGKSQKQLLAGVVRKKSTSKETERDETPANKKPKTDDDTKTKSPEKTNTTITNKAPTSMLLPGIGTYSQSESSSSDEEKKG